MFFVPSGIQTMISLSPGEIRRRSAGSLVATACPALSAQTTTWASTISAVPVRARTMPTAVESGPSRATRSVPACRINRDRRACLAGLRMAWASAVAGIVIRIPRSLACARMTSIRRSFRSTAISPPASKVMPLTRPFLSGTVPAAGARESRRPTRVPFS